MYADIFKKSSKRNPLIVILISFFLLFCFQNCSKAEFDKNVNSESDNDIIVIDGFSNPNGFTDNNDEESEEIIKNCEKLKAAGQLLEINKNIKFEDTKVESGRNQVCLFGQFGNLSQLDSFQRARYEQERNIQLPEGAELCDLNINMDRQTLKYDDMFYLTFNGIVIASNSSTEVTKLETNKIAVSEKGLINNYKYDWSKIVGSSFNNQGEADYCLGSQEGLSSCQWPNTEETGDFQFAYDPELLINLGARSTSSTHELMFSITGDNDPNTDCYHEAFEFEVKAKYYIR